MNGERFASLQAVAGVVSRETFDRLEAFERIFLRWAARINLSAPSTLSEVWTRHVLDSAQLFGFTKDRRFGRWVDIGTGGGFPGAVLAIMAEEQKTPAVALVESNSKKAAFLRTALADLAPNAEIICDRAENYIARHSAPQAMSARALANLSGLISLSEPWLTNGTTGYFHKGREYRGEVQVAHDTWNLDLIQHQSAVDAESVILEIRSVRRNG